jgi:hypothetical protein
MLDIAELIKRITEYINSQDEELSKKELKKAIGEIYDAMTKPEKKARKSKKDKDSSDSEEKVEKKKRAPTAYNLFMREQMAKLKESESEDDKMTAKAKMEYIASLWKDKKASESEGDEKKDKKEEEDDEDKEDKEDKKEDEKKEEEDEEDKGDKKKKGGAPRKALGVKKGKKNDNPQGV